MMTILNLGKLSVNHTALTIYLSFFLCFVCCMLELDFKCTKTLASGHKNTKPNSQVKKLDRSCLIYSVQDTHPACELLPLKCCTPWCCSAVQCCLYNFLVAASTLSQRLWSSICWHQTDCFCVLHVNKDCWFWTRFDNHRIHCVS